MDMHRFDDLDPVALGAVDASVLAGYIAILRERFAELHTSIEIIEADHASEIRGLQDSLIKAESKRDNAITDLRENAWRMESSQRACSEAIGARDQHWENAQKLRAELAALKSAPQDARIAELERRATVARDELDVANASLMFSNEVRGLDKQEIATLRAANAALTAGICGGCKQAKAEISRLGIVAANCATDNERLNVQITNAANTAEMRAADHAAEVTALRGRITTLETAAQNHATSYRDMAELLADECAKKEVASDVCDALQIVLHRTHLKLLKAGK